jgi:hypothetical protein
VKARRSFISVVRSKISEGFAFAVRAMAFEAGILPSGIAPHHTTSNPEDS